jgi:hypothetical protein
MPRSASLRTRHSRRALSCRQRPNLSAQHSTVTQSYAIEIGRCFGRRRLSLMIAGRPILAESITPNYIYRCGSVPNHHFRRGGSWYNNYLPIFHRGRGDDLRFDPRWGNDVKHQCQHGCVSLWQIHTVEGQHVAWCRLLAHPLNREYEKVAQLGRRSNCRLPFAVARLSKPL